MADQVPGPQNSPTAGIPLHLLEKMAAGLTSAEDIPQKSSQEARKIPDGPKERRIFKTDVIGRTKRFDPLAVWKRYEEALSGSKYEDIERLARLDDPIVSLPARVRIAVIAAAAFRLPLLEDNDDEDGLTYEEAIDLLYKFFEWNDSLKKNTAS